MMCQSRGRAPILTIGLGRTTVSSASRVPRPPARMTVFMMPNSPGVRDPARPRRSAGAGLAVAAGPLSTPKLIRSRSTTSGPFAHLEWMAADYSPSTPKTKS